jgi:predicted MPP superfamily phosphohydrolase
LAGHTHGGQVYIPFIGRPIVPIRYKKYAYGHFNENGRQLFITSGIGTAIIPIRFLTPPEIVVLKLVPALSGKFRLH